MKINHKEDYAALRRDAYPTVGDQLDAIWAVLISGKIADAKDMLAQINAVKTKYAKK